MLKVIVDAVLTVLEGLDKAGLLAFLGVDEATLEAWLERIKQLVDGLLP